MVTWKVLGYHKRLDVVVPVTREGIRARVVALVCEREGERENASATMFAHDRAKLW